MWEVLQLATQQRIRTFLSVKYNRRIVLDLDLISWIVGKGYCQANAQVGDLLNVAQHKRLADIFHIAVPQR